MSSIDSSQTVREIEADISMAPGGGLSLAYAKLQLAQAELCKNQAEEYMEKIKQTQEDQKKCAEMIEKARQLQREAETPGNNNNAQMPADMIEFFEAHGMKGASTDDTWNNPDEWEENIKSLSNLQETLGTETQTDMVYLQDLMGQYNAFLQGASKAVSDNAQTIQSIATR